MGNSKMRSAVVVFMVVLFGTTSLLGTVSAKSLTYYENGDVFPLTRKFNQHDKPEFQREERNELNDLYQFQDGFKKFLKSRDKEDMENFRRQILRPPCIKYTCKKSLTLLKVLKRPSEKL
ncbi:hypothetical protein AC249_AIPGENE26265 [Exaiptasia diaphana]|nr:hypothetical protein AC249_AIPGENE26265 [Exaiptasia diaphana]